MSEFLITLGPLVEERQRQTQIRDDADRQVRALSDQIGVLLIGADTPKTVIGDWSVSVGEMSRESLSKDRLIDAGVTTDQIIAATSKTTSTVVTVRRVGGKKAA